MLFHKISIFFKSFANNISFFLFYISLFLYNKFPGYRHDLLQLFIEPYPNIYEIIIDNINVKYLIISITLVILVNFSTNFIYEFLTIISKHTLQELLSRDLEKILKLNKEKLNIFLSRQRIKEDYVISKLKIAFEFTNFSFTILIISIFQNYIYSVLSAVCFIISFIIMAVYIRTYFIPYVASISIESKKSAYFLLKDFFDNISSNKDRIQ